MSERKVTILDVRQAKEEGRKLVMCTAYDYPFALMADEAGMEHGFGGRLPGNGRYGTGWHR